MWLEEDFSAEVVAVKIWIPLLVIGGRQDLLGVQFQEDHLLATFGRWYPNADLQVITDASKVIYTFRRYFLTFG